MKSIYKMYVTAFGAGYSPIAPGTCGAIVACVIILFLESYGMCNTLTPIPYIGLIVGNTILGIIATNKLEDEWGKDPQKIVVDEVIGMWITMLFVPVTWLTLLIGFILFRFFDIAKPLGVRKMEKLPGGVGVMADDMLAGIYANVCLLIIIRFL